jgi:hypothetical protein
MKALNNDRHHHCRAFTPVFCGFGLLIDRAFTPVFCGFRLFIDCAFTPVFCGFRLLIDRAFTPWDDWLCQLDLTTNNNNNGGSNSGVAGDYITYVRERKM